MRNTTRCGARIIFDSVAEQIEDALLAQVHKHRLDAIVLVTQNINGERGLNGVRMFFRSGIAGIRYAVAHGWICHHARGVCNPLMSVAHGVPA